MYEFVQIKNLTLITQDEILKLIIQYLFFWSG
ncbi:MAG: hypothetical protein RI980_87 [Bacteroidota bacterium]|jgi:hypothetical protein